MPEAIIGNVAGAVVGGLMGGDSQGGSQTVDKSPWSTAVPWLTHNLVRGEGLQNYYQANPFNAVQQAAYGNLFNGNDYINQMVPGLLSQFSRNTGFDRNNPRSRPGAYAFPAMQAGNYQPTAGLLGASTGQMNTQANPWATAGLSTLGGGIPPTAPAAPGAPSLMQPQQPLRDEYPGG